MTKTLEDLVSEVVNGTAAVAVEATLALRGRIIYQLGEDFITISGGAFANNFHDTSDQDNFQVYF